MVQHVKRRERLKLNVSPGILRIFLPPTMAEFDQAVAQFQALAAQQQVKLYCAQASPLSRWLVRHTVTVTDHHHPFLQSTSYALRRPIKPALPTSSSSWTATRRRRARRRGRRPDASAIPLQSWVRRRLPTRGARCPNRPSPSLLKLHCGLEAHLCLCLSYTSLPLAAGSRV